MSINYGSALTIAARGIKKHFDNKIYRFDELDNELTIHPESTVVPIRQLLGYDFIEITSIVNGVKDTIKLEDLDYIKKFVHLGEKEFLKMLNKEEFSKICIKINTLKKEAISYTSSEIKSVDKNVEFYLDKINDYENLQNDFLDWFLSNGFSAPVIPSLERSIKSAFKKIKSPSKENSVLDIKQFHTLEIQKEEYSNYKDKVHFRTLGDGLESEYIGISQMQGAFLMYLAGEREKKEKNWLRNPDLHKNVLLKIYNRFQLPDNFENEMQEKPKKPKTWIWDFRNKYRKSIVSRINIRLETIGKIQGYLLEGYYASTSRMGNYSLIESIKHIILPDSSI